VKVGAWLQSTRLYRGWMQLAVCFGEVQTLLVIGLVYVFVIGPMGSVATLAGRDLLRKRGLRAPGSAWGDADTVSQPDLERAKRLF
jgi:hypothetical protein